MYNMRDARTKMHNREEKRVLEEVIKRLENVIELKNQGKEDESNIVLDDINDWIECKIQEIEKEIHTPKKEPVDYSIFPDEGKVFVEGNKICLYVIKKEEKEKYIKLSYQYSLMKKMYEEEKFREATWNEFMSETAFVCSIYEKITGEYIGYCSIKDLTKDDWELAIELMPDKCHKGYGYEALSLFMKKLYILSGRRFFRARVEIDNHASQGLMKKLGGIPNGISEFMLHGEEIERFQKKYKDAITDEIRIVAEEFCMDAEDILGYVLEYRFDMEC